MGQTQTSKIGQVEFIGRVAARSGLKRCDVKRVFRAMLDEILENVQNDVRVTFSNFGSFYLGTHKGHHAQYGDRQIEDYVNLKFSAARGAEPDPSDGSETEYEMRKGVLVTGRFFC